MSVKFLLIFVAWISVVNALEPYYKYSEGSCSSVRWNAVPQFYNTTFYEWVLTLYI